MSSEGKATLTIPKDLYDRLKARTEGTEFHSVTDYVIFVLEEVAKDEDTGTKGMKSEDEERVMDNLKALGYV